MRKVYVPADKLWATSDTHFHHGNILKYCRRVKFMTEREIEQLNNKEKFYVSQESINKMNSYFIDSINSCVKQDDYLLHLGDFSFSPKGLVYEYVRKIRDRINCANIIMVWGNHDIGLENLHYSQLDNLFMHYGERFLIEADGQEFITDHYAGAIWNKNHKRAIQLYGHSHSTAESMLDKIMPNRRSIDVGIDNAFKVLNDYKPFSFRDIMRLVGNKTGFYGDHHEESD